MIDTSLRLRYTQTKEDALQHVKKQGFSTAYRYFFIKKLKQTNKRVLQQPKPDKTTDF